MRTGILAGAIACLLTSFQATARTISPDMSFVDYLIADGMSKEALAYLSDPAFSPSDTLDFLRGWSAYHAKKLDEAVSCFAAVSDTSAFREKALFFGAVSAMHAGSYELGRGLLESYSGPRDELKHLQLAGLALLENDCAAFRSEAAFFKYGGSIIGQAETSLGGIAAEMTGRRGISPAGAAVCSTFVPGLGQFIAGDRFNGIMTFLGEGAVAAIAAENWAKCGPDNWKTIVFTALGATLHLYNIYGAYVSVGVCTEKLNDARKNTILYNVHIPLRNIFD